MKPLRVAAIIAGEPRFSEEFDHFIRHLQGFHYIDWYFFLWSKSRTSNPYHSGLIGPSWLDLTKVKAYELFSKLLVSEGHNIGDIVVANPLAYQLNFEPLHVSHCTPNPANVWSMWQSWYNGFKLLERSRRDYDLVIRTRGDISLSEPLCLQRIHTLIEEDASRVIVPNNRWYGYSRWICDSMAISSYANMQQYCSVIDSIPQFQSEGFIFHPETCLAEHLFRSRLTVVRHDFDIDIRHLAGDNGLTISYGRWL